MPIRTISLTRELDAFLARLVKAGEYANASAAMRDAVRALQERRREEAKRLAALRAQIQTGIRELAKGDCVEIESAELERYLSASPTRRRTRHLREPARAARTRGTRRH